MTEIAACARRLKRKQDLGLIVIDYLQLIQPDDPRDPRQEQVAKMARRLKCLARELQHPRALPGAVEPAGGGGQGGPSSAVEPPPRVGGHRAGRRRGDVHPPRGILLHEGRRPGQGHPRPGTIIVAKQRNGPTGDVKLCWFDKYTRFENFSEKPYPDFDDQAGQEF